MALSWREKYLQALAEQESDEKRFQKQVSQLRGGLQALAGAAVGVDPELDEALTPLAATSSGGSARAVRVDDLQALALKASDRKATRIAVSAESLTSIIDDLLALNPDRARKAKLKGYRKLIDRRCRNLHAYPQLLRELSGLLPAVFEDALDYRPGWLAKRFGMPAQFKQEEAAKAAVDPESGVEPTDVNFTAEDSDRLGDQPIELESSEDSGQPEADADLINKSVTSNHLATGPVGRLAHVFEGQDAEFHAVSERLTRVLEEMLAVPALEPCLRQKYADAKALTILSTINNSIQSL